MNGAWNEALVSVRDLDRWIEALDDLFGWKLESRGEVDAALLAAWQLPPQASAVGAWEGAGWLWVILWIVLAVVGIFYQLRGVAEVMLPEEKWIKAQPA